VDCELSQSLCFCRCMRALWFRFSLFFLFVIHHLSDELSDKVLKAEGSQGYYKVICEKNWWVTSGDPRVINILK